MIPVSTSPRRRPPRMAERPAVRRAPAEQDATPEGMAGGARPLAKSANSRRAARLPGDLGAAVPRSVARDVPPAGRAQPLALLLAVPTSRCSWCASFIVFHDCSHGSFVPHDARTRGWRWAIGLLLYSPFVRWQHDHAVHHARSGDLDRRGTGDMRTLTVGEDRALAPRGRIGLPPASQPPRDVRAGADRGDDHRTAHRGARRTPADAPQRNRDRSRARTIVGGLCRSIGLARLPDRVRSPGAARGLDRDLAVLCPTPIRGRLLGERAGLELHRRGTARQLRPEVARRAPVRHRGASAITTSTTSTRGSPTTTCVEHTKNPTPTTCRRCPCRTDCARRRSSCGTSRPNA